MWKKLVVLLLVFTLAINPIFCQAGVWKLIVGIGLVGAGSFMAIDGFSTKEVVDREWDEEWDFLIYEYHDGFNEVTWEFWWWDAYYVDPNPNTIEYTWDDSNYYNVGDWWYFDWWIYNHHKEHRIAYKEETKSAVQGAIGIAAIVGGGYLIIDYLLEQSKLKEKGIEAKIIRKGNTSYLLCSKRF